MWSGDIIPSYEMVHRSYLKGLNAISFLQFLLGGLGVFYCMLECVGTRNSLLNSSKGRLV